MIQFSVPIEPEAAAMMTSDEDTKKVSKTKYSKASLFSAPSTFATMSSPVVSNQLSRVTYTYDESGNVLSEVSETYDPNTHALTETKTTTHTWDAANRLIASAPDGRVLTYHYNALGNRVAKSVDGIITRYLYEGKHALLELSVNNVTLAKNIRGLSILKRNVSGKALSYCFNAHGDVTALIDKNGLLSGRYDYDAFGNLLEESDGHGNPYKYAGYEQDAETGLYNLKARYYSPKVARFISEDTYRGERTNGLSLNLYTYCHNEPVRYVDPTGFAPEAMMLEESYFNYEGMKHVAKAYVDSKGQADNDEHRAVFEYYQSAIQAGAYTKEEFGRTSTWSEVTKDNILLLQKHAFVDKKPTDDFKHSMDKVQSGLTYVSAVPGVGILADGLSVTLYGLSGDFKGMSESVIGLFTFKSEVNAVMLLMSKGYTVDKAKVLAKAIVKVVQDSKGGSDILANNKVKGALFENQEFAKFSNKYNNTAEQITIKTPSGTKTRVDAIGLDGNGNVVINEFKSSCTAPLTKNQKIAFPEIFGNGGTVTGKGKGIFTGGYQIPAGTEIKIIRP